MSIFMYREPGLWVDVYLSGQIRSATTTMHAVSLSLLSVFDMTRHSETISTIWITSLGG